MEVIVNEWLLDYMRVGSNLEDMSVAGQFINLWVKKCYKIVVGRPSNFLKKFYRYIEESNRDINCKKRFRKLNHLLLYNSEKTRIIEGIDIGELPEEIKTKIPSHDTYLVELAYSSEDKIIVTTDGRLKEKLQSEVGLKIYLPNEFLQEYLS